MSVDALALLMNAFPKQGTQRMSGGGGGGGDDRMQQLYYAQQLKDYEEEKRRQQELENLRRAKETLGPYLEQQIAQNPQLSREDRTAMDLLRTIATSENPLFADPLTKMLPQLNDRYTSPTVAQREYAQASEDPRFAEMLAARGRSQAPLPAALQIAEKLSDPQVSEAYKENLRQAQKITRDVQNVQDVSTAEQTGKQYAKEYEDIVNQASAARGKYKKLSDIDALLGDSYTGTLGPEFKNLQKLGALFGIDTAVVGNKEAAEALSRQLALTLRDPSLGGGMPGSLSDSDRKFLESMTPDLAMTAAGRKRLVAIAERVAKKQEKIANEAYRYATKNRGMLDMGWSQQRLNLEQEPMFSDLQQSPTSSTGGWRVVGKR
jgi:hypothetical protein